MKPAKREAKSAIDSRVETVHLVLPSHTNAIGTIFGGTLMSWIDIAAAICAQRHTAQICVTVSIDALHFKAPARLGHNVIIVAQIVHTGKSSMVVSVLADTEDTFKGERVRCVDAWLTFVALDSEGKPSSVPPLLLKTEEEKKAFQEAAERRELLLSRFRNN